MKKPYVLIIEDDKWLAEHYKRILTADYDVDISLNALDAIEMIDKKIPDVIILDVLLSGSTAFTLLHELQTYEDTALIPIVLCTNLANEFELEKVEPYGVKRILDKASMNPDDLGAAIRSVLL